MNYIYILLIITTLMVVVIFYKCKNTEYIYDLSENTKCNYFQIYDINTFLKSVPYCKNKISIDQYLPKHIQIVNIPEKGWGLVTTKKFKKNDIIYKSLIERMPEHKIIVFSKNLGEKNISKDIHLGDIALKHNLFCYYDCFLNHDDNPTAYHDTTFIIENGQIFNVLKAKRNIEPGSELTIHYSYLDENIFIMKSFIGYISQILGF